MCVTGPFYPIWSSWGVENRAVSYLRSKPLVPNRLFLTLLQSEGQPIHEYHQSGINILLQLLWPGLHYLEVGINLSSNFKMARSRVGKKLTVNFTKAISGLQFGQEALRKGAMLIREQAEFRGHLSIHICLSWRLLEMTTTERQELGAEKKYIFLINEVWRVETSLFLISSISISIKFWND